MKNCDTRGVISQDLEEGGCVLHTSDEEMVLLLRSLVPDAREDSSASKLGLTTSPAEIIRMKRMLFR